MLAALGGALAAAYFLRLLYRVTHGAARPAVVGIGEPVPGELVAWAPLVVLALAVGLVPALVLGVAQTAVQVMAP